MKGLWRKALGLGAIGFLIGVPVGAGFLYIFEPGVYAEYGKLGYILRHLTISGMYGALSMGGSVVYDIEEWSILRVTLTHFLIVMGGYHVFGLPLGWTAPGDPGYLILIGCMSAAYVVIWLVMYLKYKRQVQELNQELEKKKNTKDKRR